MAKITKKNNSALKWFNNVGKSLGYSSTELINNLMPSSIEFISSNLSTANDIIRELRNMKTSNKKITSMLDKDGAITEAKTFMKNALDDLKTGKFYNKEREDSSFNFDDSEFSFSDEFGIDDDLFNENEDFVSVNDKNVTINKNVVVNNMAPKITSNSIVMKALEGQTKAILKSSEATNNVNISLASKKMLIDRQFNDNVLSGITSINENIGLLVNFQNDSMTKYITASLKYYEENLDVLNKTLDEMKKTTNVPEPNIKYKDDDFNEALLAGGGLDLKGYLNVLKKNVSRTVQDNMLASMVLDMFKDKEMRSMIISSPLKFISSTIMASFISKDNKKILENLDKSISNFFPALFMKINRAKYNFNNPFLQLLGQIFGIETQTKTGVDLSNYTKGTVPFDGYTRKAIVEVIPGYLRKILSAITDSKEIAFDYGKGEFRSIDDMKKEFKEKEKDTILSNYDDVRTELLERMNALHIESDQERKAFRDNIDNFFINLTKNDKLINPRKIKDKDGFSNDELINVYDFGSSKQQDFFRQLVLSLPYNLQMKMFGTDVIEARKNMDRFYTNSERDYMESNAMYLFDKLNDTSKYSKSNNENIIVQDSYTKANDKTQKSFGSFYDINMTDEEMSEQIKLYMDSKNNNKKNGFFRWIGDLIPDNAKKQYGEFLDNVDSLFEKPSKILKSVVNKIDYTLYKIIFGADDDESSMISTFMNKMKKVFSNFSSWMHDKILNPLNENLFGEDGLINNFKNSYIFKSSKNNIKKLGDYLFGEPDENGKRQGGLFSDTANQFLDIFDYSKYYFTGKGYTNRAGITFHDNEKSVFSELKSMFSGFKGTIKEYLFGTEDDNSDNKNEGILSGAIKSIQLGFQNFSNAIFGPKIIDGKLNKNFVAISELTKKLKEKAPKALAFGILGAGSTLFTGGSLGLLGSLFLPGGPIGGAILGTTLGFLTQSDKFKDWLFGETVDGERTGGVINKEMQNFFKEHKTGLIGGATLGAVKSVVGMGILPSFLLPGGPIGGAIAGLGFSVLKRSKWFNEMLFGTEEDGKKVGGLFSGIYNKIKFKTDDNKNLFGNIGAGALGGAGLGLVISKFGLLGSLLMPGGPLGGALLGAAGGFALSSEKWRKVLFGEFDEDSQIRKGGVFGKFINWTKLEIFEPLKLKFSNIGLNIQEWFTKSIANPFLEALDPIKHEISKLVNNIKSMFKSAFDTVIKSAGTIFEKHVAEPFGKFMAEHVLDPMKKFVSTLVGGIGKIFGSIISSPFKMLNSVAIALQSKHEQEGIRSFRQEEWKDIIDFKGRRERGEKLGLIGGLRKILGMYDKNALEEAKYGEHGASYVRDAKIRKLIREEKQLKIFNEKREKLAERQRLLDEKIFKARRENYEKQIEEFPYVESENNKKIAIIPKNKKILKNSSKNTSIEELPNIKINKDNIDIEELPNIKNNKDNIDIEELPNIKIKKDSTKIEKLKDIKPNLFSQMATDIKIIAQEVKGQLSGVGSNTFKIRRLLQKQYGIPDEDLTGSANRDRIGIIGKIRRAMYKPIDSIKEMLMKPVKFISESVYKIGNALISIPKNIFKTFKSIGKEVFSVVKESMITIVKIPLKIVEGLGEAAKIAVEGLKIVGPAISGTIKSAFNLFSELFKTIGTMMYGAAKGFNEIVLGIGSGLGSIFKGIGETAGRLMSSFGKMLGTAAPMITDLLFYTTKKITKFTFNAVESMTKLTLNLIKTPFKLISGLFNKMTGGHGEKTIRSEVNVKGGVINRIKEIDKISDINTIHPLPVKIISTLSELPVRVVNFNTTNERLGPIVNKEQVDLSKSFYKALEEFDDKDDKEEEDKKIKLLQEEQKKIEKKHVSRKSASFITRIKQEIDEKIFTRNNEIAQTTHLKNISEDIKEHKKSWLEMFGKKGLIATGIIMAIPLVKKIWEWIKKWFGKDDSDSDSVPLDFQESITKGIVKAGIKSGIKINKNIIKPISKGISRAKSGIDNVVKILRPKFGKIFNITSKETAEEIGEEFIEKAAKITLKKGSKAGKTLIIGAKNIADEAGEKIIKESVESVSKKGSNKVLKFIKNVFTKIFKNKKVQSQIGSEVAEKSCREITEKLTEKSTNKILQTIGVRVSKSGGKATAKTGGAVASLGLTEVIFGVYNAFSGAIEAHRLFDIHPENVDGYMMLVSSVFKTILGFGWNFVVEIINEVFKAFAGFDVIKELAMIIYKFLVDEADYEKLLSSQEKLQKEVQIHNEMNETNMSVEQYQDKYHKSVAATIGDSVKWALVDKPKEFGYKIADTYYNIKDKFTSDKTVRKNFKLGENDEITKSMRHSSFLSTILEQNSFGLLKSDKTSKFIHGAYTTIIDLFDDIKTGAKKVGEGITKVFKNLPIYKFIEGAVSESEIKKNLNVSGDGKISGSMRFASAMSEFIEMITFGGVKTTDSAPVIHGTIVVVKDLIDKIDDNVKWMKTHIIEKIDTVFNIIKDLWNNFLDDISDKCVWIDEKILSPAKNKLDDLGKLLNKIWNNYLDDIADKCVWIDDKILSPAKNKLDDLGKLLNKMWNNYLDDISDKCVWIDDKILSPAKNKLDALGRLLNKLWNNYLDHIADKCVWIDEKIFSPVKEKIDDLGNIIVNTWDGLIDFISDKFGWLYEWITGKSAEDLKSRGFTSTTDSNSSFSNNFYKYNDRWNKYSNFNRGNGPSNVGGFGEYPDRVNNFTYYSQNDDRWDDYKYDHSSKFGTRSNNPTIAYRGCGPTAMAMVATELTGKTYDPRFFADIAEKGGHSSSAGTSWSFFDEVKSMFGFDMYKVAPNNNGIIQSWLKRGMPVILSGQNTKYSKSPFTKGGHFVVATGLEGNKIIINDPRGTNYSGQYDFNNVMNELLGAWSFYYNDTKGRLPVNNMNTIQNNYTNDSNSNNNNNDYNIFDLFSELPQIFKDYGDMILYGKIQDNKNISLGTNQSTTSGQFNLDYYNSDFSPLKNAILKKAVETTIKHESGGRYTVAKNDISSKTGQAISPSIGVFQWRGGNAQHLMNKMYELLPNDPEAKYYAKQVNWSDNSPWTESEQQKLRKFLEKNIEVTKKVQDEFATEYVLNTNYSNVDRYAIQTGKLKDPRAIAFLTDFANTGPDHVRTFMNSYTPGTINGSEFEHFYKEFLAKSYWGKKSNIYQNRISGLYNELKNWDPGVTGGFGDKNPLKFEKLNNILSNNNTRIYRNNNSRLIDDTRQEIKNMSNNNNISYDLLLKIVSLLEDISGNTKLTTEELLILTKKDMNVEVINNLESSEQNEPTVITSNTSNYSNPIFSMVEDRRKNKQQKDYNDAKNIAKGR